MTLLLWVARYYVSPIGSVGVRSSKQHYFLQLECAIVEFVQFLTVAMEKQERLNREHKISFAAHCYRITESTFWTFPWYCT